MPSEIEKTNILSFPNSFTFGAAVSSFQVERPDTKRKTDWDTFIQNNPDKQIIKPDEIGPDWWNLDTAKSDLQLLGTLGLNSFRFSLEWARIVPEEGVVNTNALLKYRRLLEFATNHGMSPIVTLNHFTLPDWIAKKGGWQNSKIIQYFEHYTQSVLNEFSDVNTWITINEPNILVLSGYMTHYFPPHKRNIISALLARKHMLEAHRVAFHTIKATSPHAQVGLSHGFRWYRPEKADIFAERYYTRLVDWIDSKNYSAATNNTVDFIGCNFYTGYYLDLNLSNLQYRNRKDAADIPETFLFGQTKRPGAYTSDMGWPIVPDFLLALLRNLHKTYNRPILISENGIADSQDRYRAFYMLTHLTAVAKAIEEGITVSGYLYWSAVDNLEWLYGYEKKFGLIAVDPKTGKRTMRKSSDLYRDIIAARSIDPEVLIKKYLPLDQHTAARLSIREILTAKKHSPRTKYAE